MSRIGKLPISIPAGVVISVSDDNTVTVKSQKAEMSLKMDASIVLTQEDGVATLSFADGKSQNEVSKQVQAYHGLYRALINNMVIGVSTGFKKELELVGVGYRVNEKIGRAHV